MLEAANDSPVSLIADAIPKYRADIALHASCEIDEIFDIFLSINLNDQESLHRLKKTLVKRGKELNSVILSVLGGDDLRETEEMLCVIEYRSLPDRDEAAH